MELKETDNAAVIGYFNGDTLAADVWKEKYALRNEQGILIERHPRDTWYRIASTLGGYLPRKRWETKRKYELRKQSFITRLFWRLHNKEIMFGGSVLFGLGNTYTASSLANCFVIHNPEDSYGAILKTDEEQIQLMKRRGGVGHDISHLRSKGTSVHNAAKNSTGAVAFMSRFSNSTREVAQDGRRGALMLTMRATHPDIMDFIKSKDDTTQITGANISVKVSDAFMEQVLVQNARAYEIFNTIATQAWKNGEPGLLFWDRVLKYSPADLYDDFQTVSTNPCGEIPLSPYDSCRLLSINLAKFAYRDSLDDLEEFAYEAQIYMDLIIDAEADRIKTILKKIDEDATHETTTQVERELWEKILNSLIKGRRTGLGITGLGDFLAYSNVSYASKDAKLLADKAMYHIAMGSYKASIDIAKERGAFKAYSSKVEFNSRLFGCKRQFPVHPFLLRIYHELDSKYKKRWRKYGRRNISNLTIAPTGSVSLLLGTTSGMEPVFKVYHKRRKKVSDGAYDFIDALGDKWKEYTILHPGFILWAYTEHFIEDLSIFNVRTTLESYSSEQLDELIANSPYHKSEAHYIDPFAKVALQGTLQKWIDHSISMTVNLPQDATVELVKNIYITAWSWGCKGVTVYREGSRDGVLLAERKMNEKEGWFIHDAPKRPKVLKSIIHQEQSLGIHYTVIIGFYNESPFEIFAYKHGEPLSFEGSAWTKKIKRGRYDVLDQNGKVILEDITNTMTPAEEVITRLASMGLRHGADIKFIVEQLSKSKDDLAAFSKVLSRVLKRYVKNGEKVTGNECPECGDILIYENGCVHCVNCTFELC